MASSGNLVDGGSGCAGIFAKVGLKDLGGRGPDSPGKAPGPHWTGCLSLPGILPGQAVSGLGSSSPGALGAVLALGRGDGQYCPLPGPAGGGIGFFFGKKKPGLLGIILAGRKRGRKGDPAKEAFF